MLLQSRGCCQREPRSQGHGAGDCHCWEVLTAAQTQLLPAKHTLNFSRCISAPLKPPRLGHPPAEPPVASPFGVRLQPGTAVLAARCGMATKYSKGICGTGRHGQPGFSLTGQVTEKQRCYCRAQNQAAHLQSPKALYTR